MTCLFAYVTWFATFWPACPHRIQAHCLGNIVEFARFKALIFSVWTVWYTITQRWSIKSEVLVKILKQFSAFRCKEQMDEDIIHNVKKRNRKSNQSGGYGNTNSVELSIRWSQPIITEAQQFLKKYMDKSV